MIVDFIPRTEGGDGYLYSTRGTSGWRTGLFKPNPGVIVLTMNNRGRHSWGAVRAGRIARSRVQLRLLQDDAHVGGKFPKNRDGCAICNSGRLRFGRGRTSPCAFLVSGSTWLNTGGLEVFPDKLGRS